MAVSKSVYRKIVNDCTLYETIQLAFINQLGGMEYWYFTKDSKRTVTVDRQEFNKVLAPNYVVGQRARTVFSVVSKDVWRINTDWISEYDYGFLEQLIQSPEVYWCKPAPPEEFSAFVLHPIVITNKDYPIKTMLRDNLFNMTLDFEMAYDKNVVSQ